MASPVLKVGSGLNGSRSVVSASLREVPVNNSDITVSDIHRARHYDVVVRMLNKQRISRDDRAFLATHCKHCNPDGKPATCPCPLLLQMHEARRKVLASGWYSKQEKH